MVLLEYLADVLEVFGYISWIWQFLRIDWGGARVEDVRAISWRKFHYRLNERYSTLSKKKDFC